MTAFAPPAPHAGPPPPGKATSARPSRPPRPARRDVLLSLAAAATAIVHRALSPPPARASGGKTYDDAHLSRAAYRVLRENGTERPFSSPLLDESRTGTFVCAACGAPVFKSDAKYDSGTGWPSFTKALAAIRLKQTPMDRALLQKEVRCGECDGHLGHVFRDGPRPTRNRFCINGVALDFVPE